jgi:hypothetical protein
MVLAWFAEVTRWLGLILAAGAVAAWVIDGSVRGSPGD